MATSKDPTRLGPRVSAYTPEPSSIIPSQLIIICSWADAERRHIDKYIDLYKSIAPGARVLLIQTAALDLVTSYARQRAAIKPAVRFILDHIATIQGHSETVLKSNELKILLHSFSNGGALTTTQFIFLLREEAAKALPLVGIIMDSSPDGGTYSRTHNAIVVAQPRSKVQKFSIALVAHAILLPIWASYVVGREENSQTVMRRALLDRDLVDTTNICYIYSKADRVTDWKDVHSHAEEARRKGWAVDECEFQGSSHCAHIGVDRERYIAAVKKVWDGTGRQLKL